MLPPWLVVIIDIFFIIWLFAVLFVLWMVWRKQIARLAGLEQALIQSVQTTAKAAENASEAACMLAAKLQMRIVEEKSP